MPPTFAAFVFGAVTAAIAPASGSAQNEKAKPIGPIPSGDAPTGAMQGPRYTTLERLLKATKLSDLVSTNP